MFNLKSLLLFVDFIYHIRLVILQQLYDLITVLYFILLKCNYLVRYVTANS